jgi:anti-sigma factor RsiW
MTCQEIKARTPLYLSGEMDARERRGFTGHLSACPACAQDIERLEQLDARLAESLGGDLPDASAVVRAVRLQVSAGRSRRRWAAGAIAASIAVAAAGAYGVIHLGPGAQMYADAAQDHVAEVVQRQPRHWRTGPAEIQSVTGQHGLSFARAAALAPAGYSLERAKNCGLDGQRMLHLIFTNGAREVSVYLRSHRGLSEPVRIVQRDGEQVAAFDTGRFRALVVTGEDCAALAEAVKQRL